MVEVENAPIGEEQFLRGKEKHVNFSDSNVSSVQPIGARKTASTQRDVTLARQTTNPVRISDNSQFSYNN